MQIRMAGYAVALALAAGCSSSKGEEGNETSSRGAAAGAPEVDVPAAVPEGAIAVAIAHLPETGRALWRQGIFGALEDETGDELDEELDGFLEDKLGIRVGGVRSAYLYALPGEGEPDLAVGFVGIEGELTTDVAGEHAGTALHDAGATGTSLALRDELLLFGDDAAVRAGLEVLAGDRPRLADDSALGRLLLEHAGAAYFALAIDAAGVPLPEVAMVSAQFGVEAGMVAIGAGSLSGVITGEQEGLENLRDMFEATLGGAQAMVGAERSRAKQEGDVAEAAGMIFAFHHLRGAIAALEPEVEDGVFSVDVELSFGDPAMIASVIGMSAAIAVPAFLQYIDRAKQSEASAMLAQLEVLVTLYAIEHEALPPSAPLTPEDPSACCDGCVGDWSDEAWVALDFRPYGEHRYSYEYERHDDSSFTLRALADLACDGYVTGFEASGRMLDSGLVEVSEPVEIAR